MWPASEVEGQLHKSLNHWDIKLSNFKLLSEETNILYLINTVEEEKYVLRLTNPWSCHGPDEVEAELQWLLALRRDCDIPLREPIVTPSGKRFIQIDGPSKDESYLATVFRFVEGQELGDNMSLQSAERWGKLTATLHRHAATLPIPEGLKLRQARSTFTYCEPEFPIVEEELITKVNPELGVTAERAARYAELARRMDEEIQSLWDTQEPPRLIHNDLHPWNILIHNEELIPIDFEDLQVGYPIQDIAVALFYVAWDERGPELVQHFRRGYEELEPWPEQHPKQLQRLMLTRNLALMNFLMNAPDAETRAQTPDYLNRMDARLEASDAW